MDTFRKLFQILSVYLLAKIYSDGLSTLSQDRRITEGVPYSLVCTESSAISNDVLFYKNDVNQGGCAFSTCDSSVAGYSVTQNTTSTTLHIDSVDGSREAGSWTCQHGTDPKSSPLVIALPIPAFLNESDITTDPTAGSTITLPQDIVVSVPCAYPVPNITWSYKKEGVTQSVSSNDESDPTGCSAGQNKLSSSFNTSNIDGTGIITLTVKVEHDSFNPSNNYAKLFTFEVNLGATTTPSTPEPTTTTTTSTAMENNTAITTVTTETTTTTPPIQFPLYAIAIIVVAVLAIIIVIIIYFVRKYKNKEAKETYDEASRPQGVMDINLTNKETGANNQEEGSYTSSKFNTSQMTAADDPVQDNPLPGGRSEVRMGGRSEVRMLRM